MPNASPASLAIHPQALAQFWGTGLLSTDETLGCLLAYLSDQRRSTPDAQLSTPILVLGTLLRQIGEVLDGLTGQQLDLSRAEGLWFWRWQDSGQRCAHGLASYGEALTDAVEQRHAEVFVIREA